MAKTFPDPKCRLLDLQEMWTALLDGNWNSLALVPTDHAVFVQVAVDALLSAIQKTGVVIRVIDARGVDVPEGKRLVEALRATVSEGMRAIVLVDSLIQSLSGVHLVSGVDTVVLVVHVGAINFESLISTITMIGPDRIIGSVTAPPVR